MPEDFTPQQILSVLEESGDFSRITEVIEPLNFDPRVRRKSNRREKIVDQAVPARDNGGCMKNVCCVF